MVQPGVRAKGKGKGMASSEGVDGGEGLRRLEDGQVDGVVGGGARTVEGRWEAMAENPPEIERYVDENMVGAWVRQPLVS